METVLLPPALVEGLRRADWPGKGRRLETAVGRLVALQGGGGKMGAAAITAPAVCNSAEQATEPTIDASLSLRQQLQALERRALTPTLAAALGHQSEADRRLALSPSSFIPPLKNYGVAAGGPDSTS